MDLLTGSRGERLAERVEVALGLEHLLHLVPQPLCELTLYVRSLIVVFLLGCLFLTVKFAGARRLGFVAKRVNLLELWQHRVAPRSIGPGGDRSLVFLVGVHVLLVKLDFSLQKLG